MLQHGAANALSTDQWFSSRRPTCSAAEVRPRFFPGFAASSASPTLLPGAHLYCRKLAHPLVDPGAGSIVLLATVPLRLQVVARSRLPAERAAFWRYKHASA